MKKRIIALVSAIAMILPMTFVVANAENIADGVSVVYNEAKSTSTDAWYDIYVKGYTSKSVVGMQVTIKPDKTEVNLTTMNSEKASRVVKNADLSASFTATWNNMQKTIVVKYADTNMTPASWTEGEPIASCVLPLITANSVITPNITVSKVETDVTETPTPAVEPTKVHYAAETVGTYSDGTGDAAVAYKVTGVTAGTTSPKWCAMDGSTAVENTAAIPNVDGTADFGLIVSGKDLSSVKFVW